MHRRVAARTRIRGVSGGNVACLVAEWEGTVGVKRIIHLLVLLAVLTPSLARAMCNAIPTADRTFTSTKGGVDRPYASPGREVRLALGPCDGATTFQPGQTTIELTFEPPAASPTTITLPASAIVDMRTNELAFVFPDTREQFGTYRTGPVTIVARVGGAVAARIDVLGSRDTGCGPVKPHPIFPSFTALPPANVFHCLATGVCEGPTANPNAVLATVDVAGHLLVPWDWSGVVPPGAGSDPIARARSRRPERPRGLRGARPARGPRHRHTERDLRELAHADRRRPAALSRRRTAGRRRTVSGQYARRDGRRARRRAPYRALTSALSDGRDLRARFAARGRDRADRDDASEAMRSRRRSPIGSRRRQRHRARGVRARSRHGGALIYDSRSGRLGRIAAATGAGELPRRVTVSDDLAAFYDVEADQARPDLTVLPLDALPRAARPARPTSTPAHFVATGLFGSRGVPRPPRSARSGRRLHGPSRSPAVFDIETFAVLGGRSVGGGDLIVESGGIRHRHFPERSRRSTVGSRRSVRTRPAMCSPSATAPRSSSATVRASPATAAGRTPS